VRLTAGGFCDAATTGAFTDGDALFTGSAARLACVVGAAGAVDGVATVFLDMSSPTAAAC
jgi:hypothetical protein